MPTPTARPDSEIIFKVTPEKYISTMAKMTLMGMEHAMMNVGLISFKNKNRIKTARIPPIRRFSKTDRMTICMYSPWSISAVK